jgi:hypothetical protein
MSDYTRLNKGFVNWQGQRVFVPWFGGPRVVQSAQNEIRVLKVRFYAHIAMAMAFLPLVVVAGWIGGFHLFFDLSSSIFFGMLFALSIIFGIAWTIERWSIRNWPILTTSRFGRSQFMIGYLRSRSVLMRADELWWGLSASLVCVGNLVTMMLRVSENSVDAWLPLRLVCILLGTGLVSFLSARHTVIALLSVLPISRKRFAPETSHGA